MAQNTAHHVEPSSTLLGADLGRRSSAVSVAATSVARATLEKGQQKTEEDVGQGLIVVYDWLAPREKSDREVARHDGGRSRLSMSAVEGSMIDICAVPGLEADPRQTWVKRRRIANRVGEDDKNYKDGPSCIADPTMLPSTLPHSRIMTFSYASDWQGIGKGGQHQAVNQRLEAIADSFLRDLRRLRRNCPKRPIILFGHSLGGVLIEKIVVKSKLKSDYLDIYNSIVGCVFLGAPFKGSESQAKAALAARVGSLFNAAEYTPLLELMKKDSTQLADLLTDFLDVVKEATIQLFCFYELKESDVSRMYRKNIPFGGHLPAQMELIANEDSSTFQGWDKQPLNRAHYDLNKFDSARDREWITISSVMERMASKAAKSLKARRNALPDRISNERYFEILSTLTALEADPENDVRAIEAERGQAIDDSSNLIFQNTKIRDWFESIQTGILWISLYPGMSSAMMAVAIKKRAEAEIRESVNDEYLCYFFCDTKDVKKNNTMSILKAFIRQLLKTTQRLALHLPYEQSFQPKSKTSGHRPSWDSFSNLKLAFLAMLKDPLISSVTLIVDALHKIDEDSRPEILDLIEQSLDAAEATGSHPKVRWICLGLDRPDITLRMQRALTVTASDLGTQAELIKSLKTLVRNRVVELSTKLEYSREYTFWLRIELLNRAEGNTTWVDLAVGEIASVKPLSIDVRSFAEHLKQDLIPLYRQIQARVLSPGVEGLEYTKEILRTMMIVYHNPRLPELAVLAGLPSDIWDDCDAVESYVTRCGSFLKIVEGRVFRRVQFMDTTALEYLKQEAASDLGHQDKLAVQHGVIALRCLNFMMNATHDEHPASDLKISYPNRFWLDHARKASLELPDILEDFDLGGDFWRMDSVSWWPRLRLLMKTYPTLTDLTVVHLAAYCNFPLLLEQLLSDGNPHKSQSEAQDSFGRTPLYCAANEGHLDIVRQLVARGAAVNPVPNADGEVWDPLYAAAEGGHVEITKLLLSEGAVVDVPNDDWGTALCVAASRGHNDVIKILLDAGASKIAPEKWPRGNALTAACYYRYPETAKMLVRLGFAVDVPDSDGVSALQGAVQSQDIELVEMLLKAGTDLQSRQAALEIASFDGFDGAVRLLLKDPTDLLLRQTLLNAAQYGYTSMLELLDIHMLTQQDLDDALYLATDMEKKDTVEKLLSMGASANATGNSYGNALQASAWDGTLDIMKLLVTHGADVNKVYDPYGTALQAAAFQGDKANIIFLLDSGADVNEGPVGKYGNALYAAAAGNNLEAVKVLVERGANVNASGGWLSYALLQAARIANSGMIRYLVEKGADIKSTATDGGDVMLLASYSLPKEDLQWLYERGANVHAQNGIGNTVLIGCAHYQDLESVQWLLELGVDVNKISSALGSALYAAAASGNEEICELLIQHGADPNQVDDDHPPPLIKAVSIKDMETFDVLVKHGANVKYSSERWGNVVEAAVEADSADMLARSLNVSGIGINALFRNGGTPLYTSCLREYGKLVTEMLLTRGADPNITGGKYHTPLQAAAFKGYSDLVTALIDKGAERFTKGGFYEAAANAAASKGFMNSLTAIVGAEGGAATDGALHYAIHHHQPGAVESLLDELNANVSSIGKWGNCFQALYTEIADSEINSDDEEADPNDEEEEDGDDDDDEDDDDDDDEGEDDEEEEEEEEEREAEDDDSPATVEQIAILQDEDDEDDYDEEEDEEEEEEELSDEEKVAQIEQMLRAAFEKKSVDHTTLSKEPLQAGDNQIRPLPKSTEAQSKMVVPANTTGPGTGMASVVPVVNDPLSHAQNAGSQAGAFIKGFFSGISGRSQSPSVNLGVKSVPLQQASEAKSQEASNRRQPPCATPATLAIRSTPDVQGRTNADYDSSGAGESSRSYNETAALVPATCTTNTQPIPTLAMERRIDDPQSRIHPNSEQNRGNSFEPYSTSQYSQYGMSPNQYRRGDGNVVPYDTNTSKQAETPIVSSNDESDEEPEDDDDHEEDDDGDDDDDEDQGVEANRNASEVDVNYGNGNNNDNDDDDDDDEDDDDGDEDDDDNDDEEAGDKDEEDAEEEMAAESTLPPQPSYKKNRSYETYQPYQTGQNQQQQPTFYNTPASQSVSSSNTVQQPSIQQQEDPSEILRREVVSKTKGWFKKTFK